METESQESSITVDVDGLLTWVPESKAIVTLVCISKALKSYKSLSVGRALLTSGRLGGAAIYMTQGLCLAGLVITGVVLMATKIGK